MLFGRSRSWSRRGRGQLGAAVGDAAVDPVVQLGKQGGRFDPRIRVALQLVDRVLQVVVAAQKKVHGLGRDRGLAVLDLEQIGLEDVGEVGHLVEAYGARASL